MHVFGFSMVTSLGVVMGRLWWLCAPATLNVPLVAKSLSLERLKAACMGGLAIAYAIAFLALYCA